MSAWLAIKGVHVTTVAVTLALFLLRGVWSLNGTLAGRGRWVRILPHLNDTLLLASAITLAVMSRQYPGQQGWLTAKVIGLVLYIGLGTLALKPGRSRGVRAMAYVTALAVFTYIVATAITRSWMPW